MNLSPDAKSALDAGMANPVVEPPARLGDFSKDLSLAERLAALDVERAALKMQMSEAETLPEVMPAEAVFVGDPYVVDPQPAAPGEVAQLFAKLSGGLKLCHMELSEGFEVVSILVGKLKFPSSKAGSKWEDAYGTVVPEGSFTIVLAKNVSSETKVARATWYATGSGLAASTSPAGQHVPQASAAQAEGWNMAPAAAHSVTAGANEVAALFGRAEAVRLLEALRPGGYAIQEHERPGLIRRLEAALKG